MARSPISSPQSPLLLPFPLHPPTNYNCYLSFLSFLVLPRSNSLLYSYPMRRSPLSIQRHTYICQCVLLMAMCLLEASVSPYSLGEAT